MFSIYLNQFLGIAEQVVFFLCTGLFMSRNGREIYRKRRWYILAFLFFISASYCITAASQFFGSAFAGLIFQAISVLLLGYMLFHRRLQCLLLDFVFAGIMFFSIEAGIYIMNILFFSGMQRDLLFLGSMAMTVKIAIQIAVTFFALLWLKQVKETKIKRRQALAILILPVFSLFYFISLMEMSEIYVQLKDIRLLLANILSLVLLNFYFLYLWGHFLRSKDLEKRLELFQTQSSLQYRHYEQLEEKYKESRKAIHDMKNHLSAIQHLYQEDAHPAAGQYMDDLYHMLNKFGEKYYSSNRMLNIICNDKFSFARQKGIAVSVEIGDVDFSEMKDIDITTIFANILDNAIEAAQMTAFPYIELKIQEIQTFRVVRLTNSAVPEQKKNGHMGLGLENVRHTVEKYAGTINLEQYPESFHISILFPGKEPL